MVSKVTSLERNEGNFRFQLANVDFAAAARVSRPILFIQEIKCGEKELVAKNSMETKITD